MALSNVIMLSQVAGHVVAFILSLCVLVPMVINVRQFNGDCLLFATGKWREGDGLFDISWPSKINCSFPIATAATLFVVSGVQIYRLSRLAYKELECSFLGLFMDVFFGSILCVSTLLAAIMITLGFIVWCSDITQRFPSCEIAAGQNITREDEKIDTSGFYVEMGTAQFGAWGSFACWVGLSVIALLKLINNHQMRNMKVSMFLERQRLVNDDAFHDSSGERSSTPPILSVDDN